MAYKYNLKGFDQVDLNCRLITPNDIRYHTWKDKMSRTGELPEDKDIPAPILSYNYKGLGSLDPKIRGMIKQDSKDHIKDNPDITRKIINLDIKQIKEIEPTGHPHTENITVGDVYINDKQECIISKYNFDAIFETFK